MVWNMVKKKTLTKAQNILLPGLLLYSNCETDRIVVKKGLAIKNAIKTDNTVNTTFFATKQLELSRKNSKKCQKYQNSKPAQQK